MEMTLKALGICQKVSLCYHQRQKLWINPSNVRKIQLSRFEPYPKIFWSIHYIFSKFLRAGKLCREKVVQAWSQRPNICDLLQVSFPAQLNLHLEKRFSQQIKTIIATKCCLFVCFKGGSVNTLPDKSNPYLQSSLWAQRFLHTQKSWLSPIQWRRRHSFLDLRMQQNTIS